MDARVPVLLIELFQPACPHYLEPTRLSRLCSLNAAGDEPLPDGSEAAFHSIAPLNVSPSNSGTLMENCTLVWATDVDGLWAQCTLLGPLGVVISTFKWEDNS